MSVDHRTHQLMLECRRYVLAALSAEMERRPPISERSDAWIDNERMAVADAANRWGIAHGYAARPVTVADIERIEVTAVGHIDYGSKLALYVAEFVVYGTRVVSP